MASMKRPRLSAIKALPDYRLELAFTNGEVRVVDKREAVFSKPGLVPLRDPAVFAQARVVPGEGWTVEWANYDIQIGADTLWLEAIQQTAFFPPTSKQPAHVFSAKKVAASLADPAPNVSHEQTLAEAQAIINTQRRRA